MKNKAKIISYALNMLIANADDMVEEDLEMTAEELEAEVKEIRRNISIVSVDDPGMRFVETETSIK